MIKYPQTATYWAPDSLDKYAQQSYSLPITIAVRWEDRVDLVQEKDGSKETEGAALIYTEASLQKDGFVYLGTSLATNPKNVLGAYLLRRKDSIPSIKGNKSIVRWWLSHGNNAAR